MKTTASAKLDRFLFELLPHLLAAIGICAHLWMLRVGDPQSPTCAITVTANAPTQIVGCNVTSERPP